MTVTVMAAMLPVKEEEMERMRKESLMTVGHLPLASAWFHLFSGRGKNYLSWGCSSWSSKLEHNGESSFCIEDPFFYARQGLINHQDLFWYLSSLLAGLGFRVSIKSYLFFFLWMSPICCCCWHCLAAVSFKSLSVLLSSFIGSGLSSYHLWNTGRLGMFSAIATTKSCGCIFNKTKPHIYTSHICFKRAILLHVPDLLVPSNEDVWKNKKTKQQKMKQPLCREVCPAFTLELEVQLSGK